MYIPFQMLSADNAIHTCIFHHVILYIYIMLFHRQNSRKAATSTVQTKKLTLCVEESCKIRAQDASEF